jgi:hypothetical protein
LNWSEVMTSDNPLPCATELVKFNISSNGGEEDEEERAELSQCSKKNCSCFQRIVCRERFSLALVSDEWVNGAVPEGEHLWKKKKQPSNSLRSIESEVERWRSA